MKSLCDVCGKISVGKASSSLADTIVFDYCQKCAETGAEPYGFLVSIAAMGEENEIKSINDLQDDLICGIITATLEATGITEEDFVSDFNDEIKAQKEEDFFWEQCEFDDDDEFFK